MLHYFKRVVPDRVDRHMTNYSSTSLETHLIPDHWPQASGPSCLADATAVLGCRTSVLWIMVEVVTKKRGFGDLAYMSLSRLTDMSKGDLNKRVRRDWARIRKCGVSLSLTQRWVSVRPGCSQESD